MTMNKKLLLALAVFSVPALTACDMYAPGSLNEKPVQVQEQAFSEDMPLSDVNDMYIKALAQHYTKHGDGGMNLAITYDPKSYRNTAMKASQAASDIVTALRGQGVGDVKATILPVHSQGDEAHLLVAYDIYTAQAPEGCGAMPGMNGQAVEYAKDYKLGCSVEMMIAKQVARPKDLLGRENTDNKTEGRSASNIIEAYRYGSKNESLEGESASGQN